MYSAGSLLVPAFAAMGEGRDIEGGKEPIRRPTAPLYCLAYVTPDAPGQGGQEAAVARYPVAIVAQDNREVWRRWRDKIRGINPAIVFLAYQMVHEETFVPGPGHEQLRQAVNSWCRYPDGFQPFTSWGNQRHRLYDPRHSEFQECFMRACRTVLGSYPYDGLFLDNCTIFPLADPATSVRDEMRASLQTLLLKLRLEFPNALIIGNSSFKWKGLNGEMTENRHTDMRRELQPFDGHVFPNMDMYQTYLREADDIETVRRDMREVLQLGALYGACVDAEHVLWFDAFDEVMDKVRRTRV